MYHLAQVNVARMLAPLADPLMAGFVARLDEINALAQKTHDFSRMAVMTRRPPKWLTVYSR